MVTRQRSLRLALLAMAATVLVIASAHDDPAHAQQSVLAPGDADCSGTVEVLDALLVARHAVANATAVDSCAQATNQAINQTSADIDGNGTIDAADAERIVRCLVDSTLCANPANLYRITAGTADSAEMDTNTEANVGNAHGVRVYCPVSHFSYDDPIVHGGMPDATHLHMFWGNVTTDADTTLTSLLTAERSSCEGGTNNLSAYWMPAVFTAAGEVVLPETAITYYKSFGNDDSFDRSTIQPIPNGLQMIANAQVENTGDWNLRVDGGPNLLRFTISFPQCLAVDQAGNPLLSSAAPHTGHTAYGQGGPNPNHCPSTHPYRIPQVIYNVKYALDVNSAWSLSSPMLHADYIAAWDDESMRRIAQCNIEERKECQFRDAAGGLRGQLPDRFLAPDGSAVYKDSTQLMPDIDRTPFGTTLPKLVP